MRPRPTCSATPPAGCSPVWDDVTVPEPEAKALLADAGVAVPKGVAAAYDDAVANPSKLADLVAAYGLGEPLVLKGFGGSVVHKSDVGAVRMGVAAYEPVSEPDVLVQALDPILEVQPYPDVVIHTNVQAFYSYAGDGIERLFPIIETTAAHGWPHSRLCLVLRNIDCTPPETAARNSRPHPTDLPRRQPPHRHPLRRSHDRCRHRQTPRPQPGLNRIAAIASCLWRAS